jgi:hypothetical protein
VNRYRQAPGSTSGVAAAPTEGDAAQALAARGLSLGPDAPPRVVQAYADALRLAALDERHVRQLREQAAAGVPIVRVPELATDVHDLKNLGAISDMLMRGGV